MLFRVARAAVYAVLFVSFFLLLVPRWALRAGGWALQEPSTSSAVAGGIVFLLGAALAIACIASLVVVGEGTPAPFDPPRRLVVRGPYKLVRNPMYVGAVLALLGAAIYYRSIPLAVVALVLAGAAHALVVGYEEPALTRKFGAEYLEYRQSTPRWLPLIRTRASASVR